MQAVLADVQDGTFAKRFIANQDAGAPEFLALRTKGEEHPIEATGASCAGTSPGTRRMTTNYVDGEVAR